MILVVEFLNKAVVIHVVLIFDFTDYLLKDIFDSHNAANVAVFVDDYRHMLPCLAKLLKQYVKPFAFGNKGCRSHHVFDIEA